MPLPRREQQGTFAVHLSSEKCIYFSCQKAVFLGGKKGKKFGTGEGNILNAEKH